MLAEISSGRRQSVERECGSFQQLRCVSTCLQPSPDNNDNNNNNTGIIEPILAKYQTSVETKCQHQDVFINSHRQYITARFV